MRIVACTYDPGVGVWKGVGCVLPSTLVLNSVALQERMCPGALAGALTRARPINIEIQMMFLGVWTEGGVCTGRGQFDSLKQLSYVFEPRPDPPFSRAYSGNYPMQPIIKIRSHTWLTYLLISPCNLCLSLLRMNNCRAGLGKLSEGPRMYNGPLTPRGYMSCCLCMHIHNMSIRNPNTGPLPHAGGFCCFTAC